MLLAYYRKKRGYTQAGLAQKIGLNRESIGNYERGIYEPTIKTVGDLARTLNITVTELIKDELPHFRVEKKRKHSTESLADAMNLAEVTIKRWQHKKTSPRLSVAIRLAEELGVPVETLAR